MVFDKLAQTIEKLSAIADKLDTADLEREADSIDTMISLAKFQANNLQDFVKVLKDTFTEAINNPNLPGINEKSIQEIFSIIDAVSNEADISMVNMSDLNVIKKLESQVIRIGEGILALTDDIKKLEQSLATAGEKEKQGILFDLHNDKKKLENLWKIAYTWRDGKRAEDKENWQELQELFKQRGR